MCMLVSSRLFVNLQEIIIIVQNWACSTRIHEINNRMDAKG